MNIPAIFPLEGILMLLFSFTGIIFGYILALIAPEELIAGKKYFLFSKGIVHLFILVGVDYYFYLNNQYLFLIVWSILMIALFVFELKTQQKNYGRGQFYKKSYEIANYALFSISYLLISDSNFHLILATLVFLYGLPAGTLLKRME